MSTISAVVLAAGESRRMGGRNKLLLPIDGKPLLRLTLDTLVASGPAEIVVVLGHQYEQAAALLNGLAVKPVFNEHYCEGQMTSVEAGLVALSQPCDGVMVCLGDQPMLTTQDLKRLMIAFRTIGERSILVPTYRGQRGNPVVFSYRHQASILEGRNLGCKHLIDRAPELVATLEMDTDHVVVDIDSPADYQRVLERLGAGRTHRKVTQGLG